MPPTTITMKQRPLLKGSVVGGRDVTPAPFVSFSVGTAGCNRNWSWGTRMGEAGRLDRLQCMVCYDCNQVTIDSITSKANKLKGGPGPSVLLPEYLPKVDGFLRNPHGFEQYYGLMDRDLDRILSEIQQRSERVGAPPQMVVEFLGFGGHAIVGALIHKKLADAFPMATFLPVVLIPREHALEEWMREGTWAEYEKHLEGQTVLITDNRAADPKDLDDRLSVGLASMEAAAYTDPQSGSLPETVASLSTFSSGWFGMSVARRRLPVSAKWEWLRVPPGWQMNVVKGQANELAWQVKDTIWDCMKPEAQLARHDSPSPDTPQRLVATLPLQGDELQEVKEDVTDQLKREGFFAAFPNLNLSFGAARFSGTRSVDNYLYATRFYPLVGPISSVQDIMNREGESETVVKPEDIERTGFGTNFHINHRQPVNARARAANGHGNGNGAKS